MSVIVSSSPYTPPTQAPRTSTPPPPLPLTPPASQCTVATAATRAVNDINPDMQASEFARPMSPVAAASPQKKKPRVDEFEAEELVSSALPTCVPAVYVAPAAETHAEEAADDDARIDADMPAAATLYPAHSVTWSVSAEKGYKNVFGGNRLSIHPEMEDVHWPISEADGRFISEHSTLDGTRLFVLADGHGGVEAPRFFVSGATLAVSSLLQARDWDFAELEHQDAFRKQVHTAFQILDASYSSKKVEEYRKWIDAGGGVEGATAAAVGEKKPVDDGCTLIVNILTKGWIVNINVGDSRTVVGLKHDHVGWEPIFSSSDHNMTHPAKIHHIQRSGGQFIHPYGTLKCVSVPNTEEPPVLPYTQLAGMRIYRPPTPQIRAVGVSHRRTLNLSATMGDLLFKVEPAVLSCLPDVEFVRLDPTQDYVVVAATDGVWDHMRVQNTQLQNQIVVQRVGAFLDCELPLPDHGSAQSAADTTAAAAAADESTTRTTATTTTTTAAATTTTGVASGTPEFHDEIVVSPAHAAVFRAAESTAAAPPAAPAAASASALPLPTGEEMARIHAHYHRRLALAARTLVERERSRQQRLWNDAGMESLARLHQQQQHQQQQQYPRSVTDSNNSSRSSSSSSSSSSSCSSTDSNRDMLRALDSLPDLFYSGQFRYDDATAFIIHLQHNPGTL
ncbi:hypothetical protein HDU86_000371 [Geranomyces michiganensis]|nr:hypothetical protein HDU86_000371 [Geranomyces michiganensis]